MKTAITSAGNTLSAKFDKRFGRAAWFCVYDDQTQDTLFLDNANINASNGAGSKAAERMVELGVGKVISGDFGPKAKDLLDKFDVQMVIIQEDDTRVGDIIEKIKTR